MTRLAIAVSLDSLAAYVFWSSEGAVAGPLGFVLFVAGFVMMSPNERNRPMSVGLVVATIISAAILVSCIVFLRGEQAADIEQDMVEQSRRFSQAYFVLPAWALLCCLRFNQYRLSRKGPLACAGSKPS